MNVAQTVGALRKAGDLDEATQLARENLRIDPSDAYLQNAYGWVIYNQLKNAVTAFEENRLTAAELVTVYDRLLRDYARLRALKRPDLLHSLILNKALKGAREWQPFLGFAKWWNPACFREDDRQDFVSEGGRNIASLEKRFNYAIGRALQEKGGSVAPDLIGWAEQQLDQALERYPDDQWLNYYKSKWLQLQNRDKDARKYLLSVVKRQRSQSWAWGFFGQSWEKDSEENALHCYRYAVQLPSKPEALLKIRVRLAEILVHRGLFAEAAPQVREALVIRERMGWRIPGDLLQLSQSGWYAEHSDDKFSLGKKQVEEQALSLLYEDAPVRLAVVDNQNVEKRLAHIAFSPEQGIVLRYSRFTGIEALSVGEIVEVVTDDRGKDVIRWSSSKESSIDGLVENIEGKLRRLSGKEFGFISRSGGEDVFVPPQLLATLADTDNMPLKARIIRARDQKKGIIGWKALSVAEIKEVKDNVVVELFG